jgi:hypothetical protein
MNVPVSGGVMCTACSVFEGSCPDCGTLWLRRPDGKALGLRVRDGMTGLVFGLPVQGGITRSAGVVDDAFFGSVAPEWMEFRAKVRALVDEFWDARPEASR